ncbi:MAG: ribonuclease M5 [Acholeplasmataceae bacterium]|nr:ribonuclease M5 [Acholeplasmataceae bacterium]
MRPRIFVVEGKHDEAKLKQIFPQAIILTTQGSAVDEKTVNLLIKLDKTHDIILFLDPDHAGERIRRILSRELTHVFHVFLTSENAKSKNMKKIGIEHASTEAIEQALSKMKMVNHQSRSDITHVFLHQQGLVGGKNCQQLRNFLADQLNLGHVNGKTLYQRLKMFNVTKKQVNEVLSETLREEEVRTEFSAR